MTDCMIVDDSSVIRKLVRGILEPLKFSCTDAENGKIALDACLKKMPQLIMLEGEGPFFMHHYCDPSFRDRVAAVAERATGEPLRRGTEARASTDSIITSRAGYPSTCIASWEPDTKLLSNYHLFSDTPENLDYDSVERATVIAEALARDLATGRRRGGAPGRPPPRARRRPRRGGAGRGPGRLHDRDGHRRRAPGGAARDDAPGGRAAAAGRRRPRRTVPACPRAPDRPVARRPVLTAPAHVVVSGRSRVRNSQTRACAIATRRTRRVTMARAAAA